MAYFSSPYFDASYFDTGSVAVTTGSGVGGGMSWNAESQAIWAGELLRRTAMNRPTEDEIAAQIAAMLRKRREEEWLLGLTPQETAA